MRNLVDVSLVEEEAELEESMHNEGVDRFWHTIDYAKDHKQESGTMAGQNVLKTIVPFVSKAIVTGCDTSNAHRAGKAIMLIRKLNPQIVALIALRVVLDGLSSERSFTSVALNIGIHIEDEARFTAINPKQLKKMMEAIKHSDNYRHKHIAATHFANFAYHDEWQEWTKEQKIHVGTWLIDVIQKTTGFLRIENVKTKAKECMKMIYPTTAVLEMLDDRNVSLCELFPIYQPMIVPPKPWLNFRTGGYLTPHIPQSPFVKTKWIEHKKILKSTKAIAQMHEVYDGVNAIQDTAWRINTTVLDTLQYMYSHKSTLANLPYQEIIEAPRCPICGGLIIKHVPHACFETDKEALESWKRKARQYYSSLSSNYSRTELIGRLLKIAQKYKGYSAIYFPYNCDFRGRIYAIPQHLHPQGSDFAKGLLEFAEGKKITTPESLTWLKIAGANHYGIDKAPFNERIAWVDDHEELIKRIAQDPLECVDWTEADEPFQFLRWCLDYAGYLADPQNYESHTVIGMDGSCNGLQHFSALLRDPVGAAAVNLQPSSKPSDIYQIVADKVIADLQQLLNEPTTESIDKEMATRWMSLGISRKTTKRSVMVVPYGGTQRSCREYIQEYITEKHEDKIKQSFAENIGSGLSYTDIETAVNESFPFSFEEGDFDVFKASLWLAKYVWSAISTTVIGARSAMGALQSLSRLMTKEGIPVKWTTPDGFIVWQGYTDMKTKTLKTKLGDTEIYIYLEEAEDKLSSKDQANGVSPNFIHSMDATALIKTVLECKKQGVNSFGMIHDSYGTHAADAPILARVLREQFIKLYTENSPLETLWKDSKALLSPDVILPELPEKGDFDINKVSDSLYFFA